MIPTWDWDNSRGARRYVTHNSPTYITIYCYCKNEMRWQSCWYLYCKQSEIRNIRDDERCRNIKLTYPIECGSACRLNWTYMRKWRLKRCHYECRRMPWQLVGASVGFVAITTPELVSRLTRWKLPQQFKRSGPVDGLVERNTYLTFFTYFILNNKLQDYIKFIGIMR
jgi:hypothetical protein